jgi:hypothetical protein
VDKIYSPADFLAAIFDEVNIGDLRDAQKLSRAWKSIVLGIKAPNPETDPNRGEKMYSHSKLVDLKNGVLFIETDHPGWSQMFQLHRDYILTGLKKAAPELEISALALRLQK